MTTAVVTGGSRGIGRAVVLALAERGYRVRFVYRCRDDAAAEVVERVEAAGGAVSAHRCDIADREQVDAFLEAIEGDDVGVVVNNAATLLDGHLLLMGEQRWSTVIDTGLTGVYRVTRGCLRSMLRRRAGRIVNVASLSAILGQAGQANYAAAKGGLLGFTRALARELGPVGITVNAVVPGWIETDLLAALPASRRTAALETVPMGRFGRPDDVAAVIAFLVSDGAAYITGATVKVDGGLGA